MNLMYKLGCGLCALFSIILVSQLLVSAWGFTTDDIYISLRYAKNLANGHGLAWNIGEARVEGFSNLFYVALGALALLLKLPADTVLKSLSTLCLFLANINLYFLGRRYLPPLLSLLCCSVFSLYVGTLWWTVSGMETLAYVFLTSLCLLLIFKQAYRASAIILFLACLLRPEAPIFFVIITAVLIYNKTNPRDFILWFLVPYVIYFITRALYFDQFLPNSILCKHYLCDKTWKLIVNYLKLTVPFLLFLPLFIINNPDRRHGLFWLPSLAYLIILYNADPIIGELNRHFLAALPLLIIATTAGLYQTLKSEWLVVPLLLIFSISSIDYHTPTAIQAVVKQYQHRTQIRIQTADWLNSHINPTDFYVISDAGLVPYLTAAKVLDSFCLNSREFVRAPINYQFAQYADWILNTKQPAVIIKASYLFANLEEPMFFAINNNPELQEVFNKNYQEIISFTTEDPDNFKYTVYQRSKLSMR